MHCTAMYGKLIFLHEAIALLPAPSYFPDHHKHRPE